MTHFKINNEISRRLINLGSLSKIPPSHNNFLDALFIEYAYVSGPKTTCFSITKGDRLALVSIFHKKMILMIYPCALHKLC